MVTGPQRNTSLIDHHRLSWSAYTALSLAISIFGIAIWIGSYDRRQDASAPAGTLSLVQRILRYGVEGTSPGSSQKTVIADEKGLLPGDVVLASKPGGGYGYFTHSTALIGPDEILGLNINYGIYPIRLADLRGYNHIRVMRADLNAAKRRAVARYLRRLAGKVFQMTAHKRDRRVWTCAKAVWAAYQSINIDLVPDRDFLVPDDIAASRYLKTVREWTLN